MDDATCCWSKNSKNLRTKIIKQAVPQPDWGSYMICAILGRYGKHILTLSKHI